MTTMLGMVLAVVGGVVVAKAIGRAFFWRRVRRAAFWSHMAHEWRRAHEGRGHGQARGEGGRAPGFRGSALYRVFERLDATPAQERAIREAMSKLDAQAEEAKQAHAEARKAVAAALKSAVVTPESLQELDVAHAKRLDGVRDAVAAAVGEVHAALDEKQRTVLADAIEAGELDLGLGALFGVPADDGAEDGFPFSHGRFHRHGRHGIPPFAHHPYAAFAYAGHCGPRGC